MVGIQTVIHPVIQHVEIVLLLGMKNVNGMEMGVTTIASVKMDGGPDLMAADHALKTVEMG